MTKTAFNHTISSSRQSVIDKSNLLRPVWPAPSNIVAFTTTRMYPPSASLAKVSDQQNSFAFNLALHVEDQPHRVIANRKMLQGLLDPGVTLHWLEQTHSTTVMQAGQGDSADADACFTTQAGEACCVLTADCLPIVLTTTHGDVVAAVHAGWRGLAAGIVENAVASLLQNTTAQISDVLVWMGPAIGPQRFEVGREVQDQFADTVAGPERDKFLSRCFLPSEPERADKCLANLYEITRYKLQQLGANAVFGGEHCTYSEEETFFSYRKQKTTGRMCTLIYLKPTKEE